MVDAVELRFVDQRVQALVQVTRGLEVVTERLLDHDASAPGQACARKAGDDSPEERRRHLEVEDGLPGFRELVGHTPIRRGVREVAVHVRELRGEALEHVLVERLAGGDDRVARVLDELLQRPVVERHAEDAAEETPPLLEAVQRTERHHAREVARDPEHDENVGGLVPVLLRSRATPLAHFSSVFTVIRADRS